MLLCKIWKNLKIKKKSEIKDGLKIIWKYILIYKKTIIKITILSIIIAISSSLVPYFMGKIIDTLGSVKNIIIFNFEIKNYIFYIFIFSFFILLNRILTLKKGLLSGKLWNTAHVDYRSRYFEKMITVPFSFHKEKKLGEWQSMLDRASAQLPHTISNRVSMILPSIFTFIFAIIISSFINVYLSLVLLLGVSSYIYIIIFFTQKLKKVLKKENKAFKDANGKVVEVFTNIFELKKSTTEDIEIRNKIRFFNNTLKKIRDRYVEIWNSSSFFRSGIVSVTKILILILSISLFFKKQITIGEIVTIFSYTSLVFVPVNKISGMWLVLINSIVQINDAEKILETKSEIYKPEDFIKLPKDFKGQIEFKNVDFSYDKKEKKVLKNVSFKIKSGEKVAFVGESGVGKSTAIDLIGAFYFPQKGNVLIDKIETNKLRLKDLRSKMAFVSQEISLFNDTIENNIKYGSEKVSKKDIIKASKKAFADDFIKEFPKGYKTLVGNKGVKLSGGQKQRISIARAILRNPKILILDEPTSSLDIKSEKYIVNSLKELMKGRTTIIIAHRLSTVRNADKIFVFKKGKIVESGNHKELMKIKNGEYKNMHDMSIGLS